LIATDKFFIQIHFSKNKKSFLDKKKEAAFGVTGGPALINYAAICSA
jgi:hypothetical protein